MYSFYANILKAVFSKKSTFDRVCAYFKAGLHALTTLLLCFIFQSTLQAQGRSVSLGCDPNCGISSIPLKNTTGKKLYYFALKNNLLYDAMLLPNITAEVYLGKQFSLAVEGNWSWWSSKSIIKSDWYHRIQSVGAELRYWINSSYPLNGHAVGVYSMIGNYDIRTFAKNEDSKGWLSYGSWSAGLSYAYSMPITRRLNLELGLAVGYLGGKYYDYNYCIPHERWEQQAESNRSYFGPTRVGASIVWLFGSGNNIKNKSVYGKKY